MNKGIVIFIEGDTEFEFYKKLENLFKKANRVYIKGGKVSGFIESLDIKKIMVEICSEIKPLCKKLGVTCYGETCKSNNE